MTARQATAATSLLMVALLALAAALVLSLWLLPGHADAGEAGAPAPISKAPAPVAESAPAVALPAEATPPVGLRPDPQIPRRAHQYHRQLTREARRVFGLSAPVGLFAGQIHQESAWRPDVDSPYAAGLAQFTPATAEWMGELDTSLVGADVYNPAWALRALVVYDDWLWRRQRPYGETAALEPCERWAMTLSAYNGGLGWVNRDRRLAREAGDDPDRWWGSVERHTNRADWAREENREYPRRILHRWAPVYEAAGWGWGLGRECGGRA